MRGSSAAAIATFTALCSHVVGGGEMPGALGVVVPLVLSLMVCILLAGRRLSLPRLALSVIASQLLFHALFVLGSAVSGSATSAGAGHHHGLTAMTLPVAGDAPLSAQALALVPADAAMWAGHAVSALVTIALLHRGERALLRLRDLAERCAIWLRYRLSGPVRIPILRAPARIPAAETGGWTVLARIRETALRRRGPPAFPRIVH